MNKRNPLFMLLGTGAAFFAMWRMVRKRENARHWEERALEEGPGTAVITGASSGIGEAFARALAQQGYRLVLIARREERLQALAQELQRGPVKVDVLPADLSDPAAVEWAAGRLAEISDITLLVNNAGFGTGGKFAEIDPQPELRMIQVHNSAALRLARAVLPGMVAQQRGGIINVASTAGLLPLPGNTTYGSTKAFLIFFSQSLDAELAREGIRVQALCPGFTYSEFHDVANVKRSIIPGFLWMHAEAVVAESLRGLREGQVVVIPGAVNRALALFMRCPLAAPLARLAQEMRYFRHL